MTIYRVRLEQDGDDVILPFPDELLEKLGWGEGTNIEFTARGDGSFLLTKVEDEA
ncbi:MAG: AbrB/MazE/SpoVT family DNA-binding domain-containing protein [Verrucomicrobiaceae bacterium]|nr:MAG: AbrB/MazE/SpoVT family DNA-binding domain-containing protein [Verrucomicrobiaceae bacterium]